MRIAFISGLSGCPWGGSEVLWSETAKELRNAGNEVFVSVHGWPSTPEPIASLALIGIIVDERRPPSQTFGTRFINRAKQFLRPNRNRGVEQSRTARAIKSFGPDLVCISHGGTGCALDWMEWCLHEGMPYVSIAQAVSECYWPSDDYADRQITAYLGARAAFFVSDRNIALFESQLGTRLPNTEVVRNPFQVPYDCELDWPPTNAGWNFACVGRLEPMAKGQDLLFNVLARESWRGRNWHLNLYGTGNGERCLKRLASTLNIVDKVTFCGHVDNVHSIWQKNHILILPSRFEGLPLALVEAMLCSRTAIVPDIAGNTELVEDQVTGFVAKAATINLLAEALDHAWRKQAVWQQMGRDANKRVKALIPESPASQFAERLVFESRKTKIQDRLPTQHAITPTAAHGE